MGGGGGGRRNRTAVGGGERTRVNNGFEWSKEQVQLHLVSSKEQGHRILVQKNFIQLS